jgi:hypothetical protein
MSRPWLIGIAVVVIAFLLWKLYGGQMPATATPSGA